MKKIKLHERQKLQDLAKQVAELSSTEKNAQRLQHWKDHNSLKKTRPPVYLRLNCWKKLFLKVNIFSKMAFYGASSIASELLFFLAS